MDICPYTFSILQNGKKFTVRQRTTPVCFIPITIALGEKNHLSLALSLVYRKITYAHLIYPPLKTTYFCYSFIILKKLFMSTISTFFFLPLYIVKEQLYKTVRLSIAPLPAIRGFIMISLPPPDKNFLLVHRGQCHHYAKFLSYFASSKCID